MTNPNVLTEAETVLAFKAHEKRVLTGDLRGARRVHARVLADGGEIHCESVIRTTQTEVTASGSPTFNGGTGFQFGAVAEDFAPGRLRGDLAAFDLVVENRSDDPAAVVVFIRC